VGIAAYAYAAAFTLHGTANHGGDAVTPTFRSAWTIADVFFNIDNLIIETYRELTGVLLACAIVMLAARLVWLNTRKPATAVVHTATTRLPTIPAASTSARMLEVDTQQFNRLANLISTVSQRAEHVSSTQSQAALKLDTVEMAMHRLLSDVDGLVDLPKHMPPPAPAATVAATVSAPRAIRAA
jgi:hypothetical protein